MNASVRLVTPLAIASVAPIRPARYAWRYTTLAISIRHVVIPGG
jgi:hypothetical protein